MCETEEDACLACDAIAPEHLQLSVSNARSLAGSTPSLRRTLHRLNARPRCSGTMVWGPTTSFPRGAPPERGVGFRSWTSFACAPGSGPHSDLDPDLIEDVAWFARQEGLEAHARAAEIRRRP